MKKENISALRQIPLEDVLERLGAQRDAADPQRNWKTEAGRVTVTGDKFFNHDLDKGGGGAIDLVMQVGDYNFKEAVAWLGGNIGREQAVSQYQHESGKHANQILDTTPVPRSKIPEPVASKTERVRDYLINKRAIPEPLVDNAINKGRLWADKYGNAVFGLRTLEGEVVGAELRGTYDKPFHGVRGDKGTFITGNASMRKAVFVEAAIDALSYQAINPSALVLSTTGAGKTLLQETAKELHQKGFEIFAGFDNDKDGELFSKQLAEVVPGVKRLVPENAKDWNQQLQQSRQAQPEPATPKGEDKKKSLNELER